MRLHLKVYDSEIGEIPGRDAGVSIPNLDISVDMLKAFIQKDASIVRNLHLQKLAHLSNLQVGTVDREDPDDKGSFCGFRATCSLKELGVANHDILYISF